MRLHALLAGGPVSGRLLAALAGLMLSCDPGGLSVRGRDGGSSTPGDDAATETCTAGAVCGDGDTSVVCCAGRCVDTRTDPANCGGCGVPCDTASGRACAAGRCVMPCPQGHGDCDGNPGNGCETDLTTSMTHCGACNAACGNAPHATSARCAAGVCSLQNCETGWADCNRVSGDGCEVSTRTDPLNCGGCGRANLPEQRCDVQDDNCNGLTDEACTADGQPIACTGTGLVKTIAGLCWRDLGTNFNQGGLEIYCVSGIARFCRVGAACPWRAGGGPTLPTPTCSADGIPNGNGNMGQVMCDHWIPAAPNARGYTNYNCDARGRVIVN